MTDHKLKLQIDNLVTLIEVEKRTIKQPFKVKLSL